MDRYQPPRPAEDARRRPDGKGGQNDLIQWRFPSGGTPAIGPASPGFGACSGDPGAKQLEAVNDLLRQACYVSAYLSAKVSLWRSRGVANLDGVGGRAAPGGG